MPCTASGRSEPISRSGRSILRADHPNHIRSSESVWASFIRIEPTTPMPLARAPSM